MQTLSPFPGALSDLLSSFATDTSLQEARTSMRRCVLDQFSCPPSRSLASASIVSRPIDGRRRNRFLTLSSLFQGNVDTVQFINVAKGTSKRVRDGVRDIAPFDRFSANRRRPRLPRSPPEDVPSYRRRAHEHRDQLCPLLCVLSRLPSLPALTVVFLAADNVLQKLMAVLEVRLGLPVGTFAALHKEGDISGSESRCIYKAPPGGRGFLAEGVGEDGNPAAAIGCVRSLFLMCSFLH